MVDERKVPEGYKVTEVGVIPDEWEVIVFNDCFELLPNNTFSRSELNYNCGDFKNIHYGDILIKFPAILDCSAMEIPFINTNHVIKNNRALVKDGDIIFADTAEDETVGKAIEIFNAGSQKLVSGLHTIPCRPKVIFEPKWLGYYLNHSIYHDQLLPYITGTKVSAISKSSIKETKVVKPLPAEQKSIAEALSDTDNLIQSLEKLINKKKKIKQGAMQQLLTGKKRLPGFSGEWQNAIMKDFIYLQVGYPFESQYFNNNSGIRLIRNRDLKSSDTKLYYIGIYDDSYVINKGDLLVGMDGDFIVKLWDEENALLNQRTGRIRTKKNISLIYLYYALEKPLKDIENKTLSTTVKHLSHGDIDLIEIRLPEIQEQKAIAQVLSDMDAEIEALEEKLEKYKTIKQGMMQELLTGRIRLI